MLSWLLVGATVFGVELTAAAQEPGSIVGRVLDAETTKPVVGAEVRVPTARLAVLTNDLGWFVIPDVADGEHVVEVARLGYRNETRSVMVAGDAATLEVRLALQPVAIAGLDVRAKTAPPAPPAKEPSPRGNAVELLRRVPGVQVLSISGEPGSTPTVTLRGGTSISETRPPLVVIDGSIATLTALVDTPASDVASIEVLKGAAAAAVYGSRGEAGVIVVTTKRGPAGR